VNTTCPPPEPGRHGWADLLTLVDTVRRLAYDLTLTPHDVLRRIRAALVSPIMQRVVQYQVGMQASEQRDDPSLGNLDDYAHASMILTAAADLKPVRRALVRRRVRRVFGRAWTELADIYPVADAKDVEAILTPWITWNAKGTRNPIAHLDPAKGLMNRALSSVEDHRLVRRLVRELRHLSRSW
jgi:hypothetical protein